MDFIFPKKHQWPHWFAVTFVLLCFEQIELAYAQSGVEDILATASAERRVGFPNRALATLNNFPSFDVDALHVATMIRIAALTDLERFDEAEQLLKSIQQDQFKLARLYLTFRIALGRGQAAGILKAAPPLLAAVELNRLDRDVVRYHFSKVQLSSKAPQRKVATKALRALANSAKDRSIRAGALRALSVHGEHGARRRLLIEFPATAAARAEHAESPHRLSGQPLVRRASQLFEMRAYDLAEPDFQQIVKAGSPKAAQEARLRLATIRMRLRERYGESVDLLKQAMTGPDERLRRSARYRYGLALGYLGQFKEASDLMRAFIPQAKRGRRSVFARYQVGRLLHEAGQFDDALVAHRAFLATKPPDPNMWIWFEGWTQYRKGAFADAIATFQRIEASRNVLVGAKALYWIAKAYDELNDLPNRNRTLAQLEERAGLSYYGHLGRHLSKTFPSRRFARQRPLRAQLPLPGAKRLPKAIRKELMQVLHYAQSGHIRLARGIHEQKRLRRKITRRLGRKRGKSLNKAVDLWLERWGPRWRASSKKTRRVPWRDSFAQLTQGAATQAFPPAYLRLAQAAGRPYGVSPWWLLSHMLQESRYQERATSHAIAMGPMQIIPRTGRIIASRIGFPRGDFLDETLFLPGVALRQAAWYLSVLRDEYDGNIQLAMAAYNGGPLRITQHLSMRGPMPFDALIEEIGAHETRNYVRKVSDHLIRYVELYGSDEARRAVHIELKPPPERPRAKMKIRF